MLDRKTPLYDFHIAHQANKYWPPVGRVDNAYGDRNLICSCPAPEEWAALEADAS